MPIETIRFKNDTATRRRFMVPKSFQHPAKGQLGMWALMIERYSQPGDLVLDPMAGSGATLLAALMGRNVIVNELEHHFLLPMVRSWARMRQNPMLGFSIGDVRILWGDARNLGAAHPWPYQEIALAYPKATDLIVLKSIRRKLHLPLFQGDACDLSFLGGQVAAVVSSPPYGESLSAARDRASSIDGSKSIEWHPGPFSQVNQPQHYGDHKNIGNLRGIAYWEAMRLTYLECWRVLRPGGLMALVLKGFTRDGLYVDLPGQTEALLLEAGWQKHDHWRRELWSLSFWRILQKRRDPAAFDNRLMYEEVLAFRKPKRQGNTPDRNYPPLAGIESTRCNTTIGGKLC